MKPMSNTTVTSLAAFAHKMFYSGSHDDSENVAHQEHKFLIFND
ncbi:hypothetical protein VIBNISOn1_p0195 [Vibrio nigripulchritudo SOn1]|uniref:Uncharacterized protein n=1 Tax=Vibrio nigripulchritudo SOn1 TaxID=1238450 RepID=A0AAV2W1G6_9VIBR|nr:hypothetical protein VIBNISOn1_p0195 [Vibrio nigripulchritudo SOn1]